ncbi:MAG: MgtC/SapB family protein [Clostridia bacterium]|nr:MgtC/SapB family protein [Clostridia bacterium]
MTLATYLNSQFSLLQNADFCFRLLLASVCGAVIGMERSRRFKEAGVRTHMVVCFAAALMMITSKYAFADLTRVDGSSFPGVRGADSARIAAQVVSGISFLCAGVIFKNSGTVKGLTTAAGIWLTAGIGLAIGSGLFVVGVCATALITLIQFILHRFTIGGDAYSGNHIQFTVQNGYDFNTALEDQLKEWKAQVTESKVTRRKDGTTDYDLILRRREALTYSELKAFMVTREDVLSFSNSALQTQFY